MLHGLQKSSQKGGLLQESYATQISAKSQGFQSFANLRIFATRRRRYPGSTRLRTITAWSTVVGLDPSRLIACDSTRATLRLVASISPRILLIRLWLIVPSCPAARHAASTASFAAPG